jgi:hypothetical protein
VSVRLNQDEKSLSISAVGHTTISSMNCPHFPVLSGYPDRLRRTERLSVLLLVTILHIAVYWLMASKIRIAASGQAAPLELMFLKPPASPAVAGAATGELANRRPHQRGKVPQVTDDALSLVVPREGMKGDPIDWNAELNRAAEQGVLSGPSQPLREFGFPRPVPVPAKPPEFGWDHAHTHRVESLPGGGLLINLNDRCVFLLNPLPFFGCGIGKGRANGDLFEHLRDAASLNDRPEVP